MLVSYGQVMKLLGAVAITVPDSLECDGCFELLAEFADAEQRGEALAESMQLVLKHLRQCTCCAYEYQALLEGLLGADEIADLNS